MEHAGKVVITRDGAEILQSLQLNDPVIKLALSSISQFAKQRGDGCKMGVMLLHKMVTEIASSFSSKAMYHGGSLPPYIEAEERSKALQFIRHFRLSIIPQLQSTVLERYCYTSTNNNTDFRDTILAFIRTNLSSLFPNVIVTRLLSLFNDFLTDFYLSNLYENVADSLENYNNLIFQVYKTPLRMSRIINGYVLSKDFKVHPDKREMEEQNVVLWSIPLEQSIDDVSTVPTIETSDEPTFMRTILYIQNLLDKAMKTMKQQKIQVIISSVYFPEWAVSTCAKYSMGLVDIVRKEEFDYLIEKLEVPPISCKEELLNPKYVCKVKTEAIHLGTSRYAMLGITNVRQIVIAGPTVTQCNQFSKAFLRCFRSLRCWIEDSRDVCSILQISDDNASNTEVVFCCPSDGYIQMVSHLVIDDNEDSSNFLYTEQQLKFLKSLLLDVPRLLHRSSICKNNESFLKHLINFKVESREVMIQNRNSKRRSIENPIQFFHCLQNALLVSETMIRTSTILYSKNAITSEFDNKLE